MYFRVLLVVLSGVTGVEDLVDFLDELLKGNAGVIVRKPFRNFHGIAFLQIWDASSRNGFFVRI